MSQKRRQYSAEFKAKIAKDQPLGTIASIGQGRHRMGGNHVL